LIDCDAERKLGATCDPYKGQCVYGTICDVVSNICRKYDVLCDASVRGFVHVYVESCDIYCKFVTWYTTSSKGS
jgi:hypothetical protein